MEAFPLTEKIWAAYAEKRLHSRMSRTHYHNTIFDFCKLSGKEFEQLTVAHLEEFLKKEKARKRSEGTRDRELAMIKSFARFIEADETGLNPGGYRSPFNLVKPIHPMSFYLSSEVPELVDVDALLAAADENDTVTYIAAALSLRLSLSLNELVSITRGRFTGYEDGYELTIDSGTSETRIIPVPDDIIAIISEKRPGFFEEADASPLFFSSRNEPLSARALQWHVNRTAKAAGLDGLTLQKIRTLSILELLRANPDRAKVAAFAGLDGRWMFRYESLLKKKRSDKIDLSYIRIEKRTNE